MTSIWTDMLGAEVRYRGTKYKTRAIEMGSGPPLILLHGIGGHAEAYSRNIRRLGEHFHVAAIDLLWHGFSAKPPVPKRMISVYAEQVIDVADSMGFDRFSVEGESLGGWITLWLALNKPERLNKIVLTTPAGVRFKADAVKIDNVGGLNALRERSIAAISNPTRETVRKRLEWLMASPDRVTEELIDVRHAIYNRPETQKSLTELFNNSFLPDRPEMFEEHELSKVVTPTLTLWADKNPGTGEDGGKRVANLIKGAEYYCIKDAAHWPQWEKAEEHDRVVLEFLRK